MELRLLKTTVGGPDRLYQLSYTSPQVAFDRPESVLTYVVNESCIKCKLMDCVEVCPVDCFYEGENMLVIHPDECIDCGVCEPECALSKRSRPDTEPGLEKWLGVNAEYAKTWPNITVKKTPPADLKRNGRANRTRRNIFHPIPGEGD